MSSRTARWVVWTAVGLYFVVATTGAVLQVLSGTTFLNFGVPFVIGTTILVGTWSITGGVIVSRHPRHPVGWILCFALMGWGMDTFSFGYAAYGLTLSSGSLPGSDIALVWLTVSGFPFTLFALTLLFLLFPTGRLLSARWGRVGWIALGGLVGYLVLRPFGPSMFDFGGPLSLSESQWAVLSPLFWIALAILALSPFIAAASLILRLRFARGDERQQLKWFVYATAFFLISIPPTAFLIGTGAASGAIMYLGVGIQLGSFVGMAMATAFAIFRYRLYDIDIIINRTLVYGILTGELALVYFMSVVILQNLIRRITGQESPIAVVASTLLIAAIFQPLRRLVQQFIDRRFYRRKYDMEKALVRFASELRDEVDSEAISRILLEVVEVTLQPRHVSLWLPPRR